MKETQDINKYKFRLNYSTCNEDSFSEVTALNIHENDVVLSITGSGGRVLNLCSKPLKKIIAIDYNPLQNFLLEIKMASIQHLEYEDYIAFIGLRTSELRLEMYESLKKGLSNEANAFWDSHTSMIEKGILFQGSLEKYYQRSARGMKFLRGKKLQTLLSFDHIKDQQAFYHKHWNTKYWKMLLKLTAIFEYNELNYRFILKDPCYYKYIDGKFDYAEFYALGMERTLLNKPLNENFFLTQLLTGSYEGVKEIGLPICLQKKHYMQIKENIPKIEVVTGDLLYYLAKLADQSIDKFSLSDITGYMPENSFNQVMDEIFRVASIKSRICFRNFIVNREFPSKYSGSLSELTELEDALNEKDDSFIYTFKIAEKILESCDLSNPSEVIEVKNSKLSPVT